MPSAGRSARREEELVSAGAGQQVPVALERLEPARDRHQQLVADRMAEAVVHELEVVEVEAEQADRAIRPARLLDGGGTLSESCARLGSPVSWIVVGEEGHPLLGQAAVGDVLA